MKLAIKWFLIGLVSTLVILFVLTLSNQLAQGSDSGIGAILTSYSYEAFQGMLSLIGMTAGLILLIPTVIIALVGFISERVIKKL